jgi:hypothetical protein
MALSAGEQKVGSLDMHFVPVESQLNSKMEVSKKNSSHVQSSLLMSCPVNCNNVSQSLSFRRSLNKKNRKNIPSAGVGSKRKTQATRS